MNVAVTGGAGFIGSHVVSELHRRGHDTWIIDHSNGLNVLDADLDFRNTDAVIHLAGLLGTSELFDQAERAVQINVIGALRMLQACEKHDMSYVSISMPKVWHNVYQATKTCARELASAYHQHHGVRVSHVRAFNAFGKGQKVHGVQKILPTFAARAWRGKPIPIWGDGTQQVDLVHVSDVAKMLVDALSYGNDEVFDAGTGDAKSVNEVAEMVLAHTGSKAGIEYLPMRPGEHEAKVVADGLGWDKLGWVPKFLHKDFYGAVNYYQDDRP